MGGTSLASRCPRHMSLRGWFVLAAMCLTLMPRAPARAGCAVHPVFAFAPEDTSELPSNPTIWVFLRERARHARAPLDELTVTDERGTPLRFVRTELATDGGNRALQLQITAAVDTVIVRGRSGKETAVVQYHIRRAPRAADALPATEIVWARYEYASGCPSSNGFLLSIVPKAPVYRVVLDGRTWIVPDQPGAHDAAREGTIVTGVVGCLDFRIATDTPFALEVTPLFSDGRAAATRSPYSVTRGPPARCTKEGASTHCTSQKTTIGDLSWELSGAVKAY